MEMQIDIEIACLIDSSMMDEIKYKLSDFCIIEKRPKSEWTYIRTQRSEVIDAKISEAIHNFVTDFSDVKDLFIDREPRLRVGIFFPIAEFGFLNIYLPAKALTLLSEMGFSLDVSIYPCADASEPNRPNGENGVRPN
jgi:hypothetical protein